MHFFRSNTGIIIKEWEQKKRAKTSMELSPQKRAKIRKRKRLAKNRRRNQRKFEVRSAKRRRIIRDNNVEEVNYSAMTADTFWANYRAAQDWQQRHNVAWWKARCIALEHENQILRKKVREQAQFVNHTDMNSQFSSNNHKKPDDNCEKNSSEEGNLEFHVDEDMLSFLEQSIRHKMELKKNREMEHQKSCSAREGNDYSFRIREIQDHEKMENARVLYGSASSKIIAMETALQVSVDRHKDLARPHYWPNIPLQP